ncbi:MAG: D-alanine--D-alanine ligase family protein [Myxococcota bacterium]
MKKTRLLVLAGGQSEEHEVSLTSARSMLHAVEGRDGIDATVRVITRAGRWLPPAESQRALRDGRATSGGELMLSQARVATEFDVVFPLLHGPNGEDGTIQGLLQMAGVPYVGSGVLASALCMDKPMAKEVLGRRGLPQVDYRLVRRSDFSDAPERALATCATMSAPYFVKPANLGSSVGISKVREHKDLAEALRLALRYDRRAIVEAGVVDARELEVAVLGNDRPVASPVGEITYASEFYDYETKYTDGRAELHIPAKVPQEVSDRVRALALDAFTALDCAGFARVDFFYQPSTGAILINEVNTIPGFTPFSMFPKLWEAAGVTYPELVERLVMLALERHGERS